MNIKQEYFSEKFSYPGVEQMRLVGWSFAKE